MKADKKATVVDAAKALLEVCDGAATKDGQGFNGVDSPIARSICGQSFITPKQASLLHKILRKYSGQLEGLGFEFKKLEVPKAFTKFGDQAAAPKWTPPPAPKVEAPPKPATAAMSPWPLTAEELLKHFPPGYTPRPQQKIALEKIAVAYAAGKRVVALEMPTGGGKSLVCKAVANAAIARGGTHFLTSQRILQDQYENDFPSPDIEILKGRGNYSCTHAEAQSGTMADDAPCTRAKKGILPDCVQVDHDISGDASPVRRATQLTLKPHELLCPYWKQLQKCHDHKITLFNFASFLAQQRLSRFPSRALMIIDEAHGIEGQLLNFVSMELSEWTLSIVNVTINKEVSSKEAFAEWLRETQLLGKIEKALQAQEEGDFDSDLDEAQSEAIKELQGKIVIFLRYLEETEWVLETVEYERHGEPMKKIVARPLFAKRFAENLLFRHAERLLCMSATILDVDVWAENLGIPRDQVEIIQTPCDFPVENRPINLDYAGNMGFKYFSKKQNPQSPTRPKFSAKVATILGKHLGQRGIIHTHSFEVSRVLLEDIGSERFLFQADFASKDEMLEEHARRKDSVIVAPAMHEGLDLKDDLSRFQIICKVPYPSTQDKVMKERLARDDRYYAWLTALKIVQSYGRSIRSKEDWATTYIVDEGFNGFMSRNGKMLPQWFTEAILRGTAMKKAR